MVAFYHMFSRSLASELEVLDTILAYADSQLRGRPRLTLDDIITATARTGLVQSPSDWVVVQILSEEAGKTLTANELITAIRNNREAMRMKTPTKQGLWAAYFSRRKTEYYPNWPREAVPRPSKFERYKAIAKAIAPLFTNFRK